MTAQKTAAARVAGINAAPIGRSRGSAFRWTEFESSETCSLVWQFVAVLRDAADRADELLDEPAVQLADAAEIWADIHAVNRFCRLIADSVESLTPRPPDLVAARLRKHLAERRLRAAAAAADEPHVVGE